MNSSNSQIYKPLALLILSVLLSSCSLFLDSATGKFADNLSVSIKSQVDPDTVKTAVPSYLIMLDAMIEGSPENPDLLRAAAILNNNYASLFITKPQRKKLIATKSLEYATNALCLQDNAACAVKKLSYGDFSKLIATINKESLPFYFTLAASWAGWIQANSDDWNAVAQLAKIRAIMQQIVKLDEGYQQGDAHLYLGVLDTLVPPALGGQIDRARKHFEKAITLSAGKNLIAKVYFAERYARMTFDRTMHDKILNEVINAKDTEVTLKLSNAIARNKAQYLLESANDYF